MFGKVFNSSKKSIAISDYSDIAHRYVVEQSESYHQNCASQYLNPVQRYGTKEVS